VQGVAESSTAVGTLWSEDEESLSEAGTSPSVPFWFLIRARGWKPRLSTGYLTNFMGLSTTR
jgi:hypothetical protein